MKTCAGVPSHWNTEINAKTSPGGAAVAAGGAHMAGGSGTQMAMAAGTGGLATWHSNPKVKGRVYLYTLDL